MKEAEITEQDSLLLTQNLLQMATFNISLIRGLFLEKYFNDTSVPDLGVYDALQKKYLKTLLFCVREAAEGPMIEEYGFSFGYSGCDSQEVMMNINRSRSNKQSGTYKWNATEELTPNQMRSSTCKVVRTLVQLMRPLPEQALFHTLPMNCAIDGAEAHANGVLGQVSDLLVEIFLRVPFRWHLTIAQVSKNWRHVIQSEAFRTARIRNGFAEELS